IHHSGLLRFCCRHFLCLLMCPLLCFSLLSGIIFFFSFLFNFLVRFRFRRLLPDWLSFFYVLLWQGLLSFSLESNLRLAYWRGSDLDCRLWLRLRLGFNRLGFWYYFLSGQRRFNRLRLRQISP